MAKKTSQPEPEVNESEQLSESYISIGLGLLVVIVVGILLFNYFTNRNNTNTTPDSTEQITQEATTSATAGSTYKVADGDTLWTISEKAYGTGFEWSKIAEANNLTNNDQLIAGQEIKIPELASPEASALADASGAAVLTASPTPVATPIVSPSPVVSPTPVVSASPVVAASVVASPVAQASVAPSTAPVIAPEATTGTTISGTSYTIAAGDTLWDIACRAYNDCYAWSKIAEANKLEHPNLIHAGNSLIIPR